MYLWGSCCRSGGGVWTAKLIDNGLQVTKISCRAVELKKSLRSLCRFHNRPFNTDIEQITSLVFLFLLNRHNHVVSVVDILLPVLHDDRLLYDRVMIPGTVASFAVINVMDFSWFRFREHSLFTLKYSFRQISLKPTENQISLFHWDDAWHNLRSIHR